jgi:diguanylate cyclase (GGDEF)-like protein
MTDYRLGDLLDMTIIQKLADSNFRVSGLPMTIVDTFDGAFLVKSGFSGICSRFHRVNAQSMEQCIISDLAVHDHLDEEVYQYRCNNGLWHIALPIVVAGRHLGTMFLTQFWSDREVVDRGFFVAQAGRYGFDLDDYMGALDQMPVFSREKVDYIVAYDQALVRFIADLAEQSIRVIEEINERRKAQEALQAANDEMELRVRERTADLASVNQLLRIEIAERVHFEEKFKEMSETDYLTGIFNRRKLFDIMELEIGKAHRYARPLALVMLDLDHFKIINDTHGHHAGDTVLKFMVQVVKGILRKADVFARYGGEEFIIVCAETTMDGAFILADKIRQTVEAFKFPAAGRVTVSAGVAEYKDGDTEAGFIQKADIALYAAKRNGRNQVVASGSEVRVK